MIFERSNKKKAVLLHRALKIISPFPVLIAALLNKLYEPSLWVFPSREACKTPSGLLKNKMGVFALSLSYRIRSYRAIQVNRSSDFHIR